MSAQPVKDVLQEVLGLAVTGMFADYDVPLAYSGGDFHTIASVLGFSGDTLRGSLGVASSMEFASGTCAHVIGEPATRPQAEDWMAEIANQLMGRVKNQLLNYDTIISMAIPSVLRGLQLRVGGSRESRLLHSSYGSRFGTISVWIDPRHEPGLTLHKRELSVSERHASEGEMMFF